VWSSSAAGSRVACSRAGRRVARRGWRPRHRARRGPRAIAVAGVASAMGVVTKFESARAVPFKVGERAEATAPPPAVVGD
jgi:hypothetical protein